MSPPKGWRYLVRVCDRCGTKQAPYHPRTRVDGEMLCDACVKAPPGVKGGGVITGSRKALGSTREVADLLPFFQGVRVTDSPKCRFCDQPATIQAEWRDRSGLHLVGTHHFCDDHSDSARNWSGQVETKRIGSLQTVAHDSGDGQTIFHCPFCGSGQVLARSDRTIECEFCHTAFTVQVQPEFSAFPQTVNGMPMQVPGMPGQIDAGAPVDPNAVAEDGSMMDQGDPMAADAEAADAEQEDAPSDGADNPFVSSRLYQTASGAWLDHENYLAHLAIINSPDPRATAAVVKASRKQA
jgi:hypothetical protein